MILKIDFFHFLSDKSVKLLAILYDNEIL